MKTIYKAILATLALGAFVGLLWFLGQPGREDWLFGLMILVVAVFTFGMFYLTFFSEHKRERPLRGIPDAEDIPPPPPPSQEEASSEVDVSALQARVTKLETPQLFHPGETVYRVFDNKKGDITNPLLITEARFVYYGYWNSGKRYRIKTPHWDYTCYDTLKKEVFHFTEDLISHSKKSKE